MTTFPKQWYLMQQVSLTYITTPVLWAHELTVMWKLLKLPELPHFQLILVLSPVGLLLLLQVHSSMWLSQVWL